MAFWTCQGEAGKALDATTRDLDQIGAIRPIMRFVSLGVDTLTYSVLLDGLSPTAELLPERGQKFILYRNGTRFFTGHCSERRQRGYVVHITISGAGWWLERLTLTSLQTDSIGASAERLTFGFPTQSLTTSIDNLLTRAIALGAPIAIGSLAATFSCPRITLNQSTCGQSLAELIRLTPDVSGWWDYTTTATPTFNTSRRSGMTTRTLAAEDPADEEFELYPLDELRAEFVRIPYVARGTDGQRVFREQLSGDEGTAQSGSTSTTLKLRSGASFSDDAYNNLTIQIISGTGAGQSKTITDYVGSTKVATVNSAWTTTPNNTSVYKIGSGLPVGTGTTQALVVSGAELDTFLPNEVYDSVQIKTVAASQSGTPSSAFVDYVRITDSFIAGLVAQFPSQVGGWVSTNYTYYTGFSGGPKTAHSTPFPGITYTDPVDGTTVSPSGKHIIVAGSIPEWLEDTLVATKAVLNCSYTMMVWATSSSSAPDNNFFEALAGRNLHPTGNTGAFFSSATTGDAANDWMWWAGVAVNIPVLLISASYPTLTTIYRPADYDFIAPPAGFAAGMQESQGWTPYAGSLAIEEEEAGGTRYRGCKVNLTGALPEYATMGALVESETLDLDTGRTTLGLGAPARLDYRTFVDRIRRTPQDNIVYV
jgi:hypothetical protein